jgi:tetratricopeptide (TPR) repeat protein
MGGDSRGKQSAALLIVKKVAGYGGFTDRAIDIRVDDHAEPFRELGRLLNFAQMNYSWNEAWTLFKEGRAEDSLPLMERTAQLAPGNPEVLYDLAVIRLAAGRREEAFDALRESLDLNPRLKAQARGDADLDPMREDEAFRKITEDDRR